MVDEADSGEVLLARGAAASELFLEVLSASADAFPDVFEGLSIPDSAHEFRSRYAELLPWFEATRAGSVRRSEITRVLAQESSSKVVWKSGDTECPLEEHLEEPAFPFDLVPMVFGGHGTLRPGMHHGGELVEGRGLLSLARALVEEGSASDGVADGIGWILEQAGIDGLSLRDRRVVVLGARAELAPIRLLLEGGAEVLWIDTQPPDDDLLRTDELSGVLYWIADGVDLLTQPNRIRATIAEFAEGNAVDICLYAYAPGQTREWRLTASMNAIVDALPSQAVRTITMLISPTTCGVLSGSDLDGEARRIEERPLWQTVLQRIGSLGQGLGHVRVGDTCTNRGIVPVQGTSYAAAQYLGKLIAAEAWATGHNNHHVSANTAGVSRTASVSHPVFDTAFAGAHAFRVGTYEPTTTAVLNGLLSIRDWIDVSAPGRPVANGHTPADRARLVTSTRVHGGIYQLPYPLDRALRVATAIGAAREPHRIGPMIKSR